MKKGLIVNDAIGPDGQEPIWFENISGGLGVRSNGAIQYNGSFYDPTNDMVGNISVLHPAVHRVVQPNKDGTHTLVLVIEEVVYATQEPHTLYQVIHQVANAECEWLQLKQFVNEAKAVEPALVSLLHKPAAQMGPSGMNAMSEALAIMKEKAPHLTASFHGSSIGVSYGTGIWIKTRHIITGVDPFTFTSFEEERWNPVYGLSLGSSNPDLSILGKDTPLNFVGAEHAWYPFGPKYRQDPEALQAAYLDLNNTAIRYRREVSVSGSFSPMHRLLHRLGVPNIVAYPKNESGVRNLLEAIHTAPGPQIMRWDSESAVCAIDAGFSIPVLSAPMEEADDPGLHALGASIAPFGKGQVTITGTNIEQYVTGPQKLLYNERLNEGRNVLYNTARLTSLLYTSDLAVSTSSYGTYLGEIKTPDKAMGEDYPVTVFEANGNKIRAIAAGAINDDTLLF